MIFTTFKCDDDEKKSLKFSEFTNYPELSNNSKNNYSYIRNCVNAFSLI